MSKISARKYIEKKLDDICIGTQKPKLYTLGFVVGIYEVYKDIKLEFGKETADRYFSNLDENDEYSAILRTLIGLDEKEAASVVEKILEYCD